MVRITTPGFKFDSHYVASRLQSYPIAEALNKLQQYEDTGLQPEEVAELAKLKESGRLKVLPCAVGDTIWEIRTNYPKGRYSDLRHDYAIKPNRRRLEIAPETCYVAPKVCRKTDLMYLGKTVFVTEEEAVAVLEEAKANARCSANE
jgi:hypothetical protein